MKKRILAGILSLCIVSANTMGAFATSVEETAVQAVVEEESVEEVNTEEAIDDIEAIPSEEEEPVEEIDTTVEENQENTNIEDASEEEQKEDEHEAEEDPEVRGDDAEMAEEEQPEAKEETILDETVLEKQTGKAEDDTSIKTDELVVSEIEELFENVKAAENEVDDISIEEEILNSKASRTKSVEENMNELITYIKTYGTRTDDGWRIRQVVTNTGSELDIAQIEVNVNKGTVVFNLVSDYDGTQSLFNLEYDIQNKTYGGVEVYCKLTSGAWFIADANLDPKTYYEKKDLYFTMYGSYGIAASVKESCLNAANSYQKLAFAALRILLHSQPGIFFPWIGFPGLCIHTWDNAYTVDRQPTYTREGSESIHCVICDIIQEGSERSIPKLVHKGWAKEDGNWKYYKDDGTSAKGWLNDGGTWYYMNEDGIMQTGWVKVGGKWYYLSGSGAMLTGWQKINNIWYYLSGSGAMVTGWQKIGSTWYYFNTSGAMQTGWQKIGSTWYYFSSGGAMQTGWQKINNKWYYFKSSGAMVTGRQKIDGKWYTFSSSGAMQ